MHPDNLLEVKTFILRRLPVLVYSEQSSKDMEGQADPTLNSLYFDNPEFSLYNQKVERQASASSIRIRWFGQLNANPELVIEQKIIYENGTSEQKKFPIKDKYVQPFITGQYKMEKSIQKMERQGQPPAKIEEYKNAVSSIQDLILHNNLQPVLRANYTRTAFQKPLDDKVRISIDTSLAFIREDALDPDRPCRNPDSWHRLDVDGSAMVYPFRNINQGEISRFPYSVLEVKIKDDGSKKYPQWVEDLMASHLMYRATRFSKFVHGVASLFEDNVNNLPFWLSELETDIRKDPQEAFDQEEVRKTQQAENENVVGSFLGTPRTTGTSFHPAISSPLGKSYMQERFSAEERVGKRSKFGKKSTGTMDGQHDDAGEGASSQGGYGTISSVFPSFSLSRYAQARRERIREQSVELPPGVTKPEHLIKDSGPLHVEPKVWLANERTFLKWQHITILIGTLALTLYNAAGRDTIARLFGIIYVLIAFFAGVWGLSVYRVRRNMIMARSGKDFDNLIGPLVISVALMTALILNFYFQVSKPFSRKALLWIAADNMAVPRRCQEDTCSPGFKFWPPRHGQAVEGRWRRDEIIRPGIHNVHLLAGWSKEMDSDLYIKRLSPLYVVFEPYKAGV